MSAQNILAEVEPLTDVQCYKRMDEFDRPSATDRDLAEVLKTLACSKIHYERLLALLSSSGSHDTELIALLLADPSQMLASRATKLASRALPDATLTGLLPHLSRSCGSFWLIGSGKSSILS